VKRLKLVVGHGKNALPSARTVELLLLLQVHRKWKILDGKDQVHFVMLDRILVAFCVIVESDTWSYCVAVLH